MKDRLFSMLTPCTKPVLACLLWLFLASAASARVVGVENGSGAGLLFTHQGNCFVILPSHVHGRMETGIRIGSGTGAAIGSARIVYKVPGDADISLGLVRGGIEQACGNRWRDLPRRLSDRLSPGTELTLQRPRQRSGEGRRLLLNTVTYHRIRVVPAPGEVQDLFGGTSGAFVFMGRMPVGMVLESEDVAASWAIRMDEIVSLLARYMGEPDPGGAFDDAEENNQPVNGDPLDVLSWSPQPEDGAVDPAAMLAGQGPWVFSLKDGPATLTLQLANTDRLRRITLSSLDGEGHGIPRNVSISIDNSSDPNSPRLSPLPPRDMAPDGVLDASFGERFAKRVIVTIRSSWGGIDPVRLDAVTVD